MTNFSRWHPLPRQGVIWFWRISRIGALCYLGVLILLLFLENWLIYHPVRASVEWWPPSADFQDVALHMDDGTPIHAWWCPKEDAQGVLLFCHGNDGNLSHRGQIILKMQRELNVSVMIFDYPGYGLSGGSPSEQGCYAAGEKALAWLTDRQKIPGEEIILYGNSLGGGVVTHLAGKFPHRAVVLAKTFTSLPDVAGRIYPFFPCRLVMRNRFDSLGRVGELKKPVVVAHGNLDELIPYEQGEKLFAAVRAPKMFYRLEDGHHNTPMPVEFFHQVRNFLEREESKTGQAAETCP